MHVCVCECVFAVPIYLKKNPLAFVFLSGFLLFSFWKTHFFCFCCCFFSFYALVFYVYCRVLPEVLSCTPTGVSEINYLICLNHKKKTHRYSSSLLLYSTRRLALGQKHISELINVMHSVCMSPLCSHLVWLMGALEKSSLLLLSLKLTSPSEDRTRYLQYW